MASSGVVLTLFSTRMPSGTVEGSDEMSAFCRLPTMPPAKLELVMDAAVLVFPLTVPAL